jgi:hypothetical protein
MTHKNRKNKFHFLKCWMLSFEGLKASPVAWTSFMEAYGKVKIAIFDLKKNLFQL